MKKLLLVAVPLALFIFVSQAFASDTVIMQPNMEEAIKFQQNITGKTKITTEQMAELRILDAAWWDIKDLEGLQYAKNLEALYAEGNQIKSLSPLRGIANLQSVSLSENLIEDLRPLESLRNLRVLDVSKNQVGDIQALKSLSFNSEGGLNLADNRIADISPLSGILLPQDVRYFYVNIANNRVRSLRGLENMTGLTELYASGNALSDISQLASLPNLKILDLENNQIASAVHLPALGELEVLNLSHNQLKQLKLAPINQNENVFIDASHNQITDISGLSSVKKGVIDLSNNRIEDISPLKGLESGKVIVKGNPLSLESAKIISHLQAKGITVSFDPILEDIRIAGSDRYRTAAAIAKRGWDKADIVIIASGESFPDALSGVPLAYQYDAPILLTKQNELPSATKAMLENLVAKEVIVLGGHKAVSPEVAGKLGTMGITVRRIEGKDRFDTAANIAKQMDAYFDTAVVAYGYGFADALSAASMAAQQGMPILLTDTSRLPEPTAKMLTDVNRTIVVGGEKVISQKVFNAIPAKAKVRVNGKNRFDTSALMLGLFPQPAEEAFFGNGYTFADSLTGSVLAAKQKASLVLVNKDRLPSEVKALLGSVPVRNFHVLGGEAVVSETLINELLNTIK